jgi:hypothetical protein
MHLFFSKDIINFCKKKKKKKEANPIRARGNKCRPLSWLDRPDERRKKNIMNEGERENKKGDSPASAHS